MAALNLLRWPIKQDQPPEQPEERQYEWSLLLLLFLHSGRRVSSRTVRSYIDAAILAQKAELQALTAALVQKLSGPLSIEARAQAIAEWSAAVQGQLRAMHAALGMIAAGGRNRWNLTLAHRLAARIRQQDAYFNQLLHDIAIDPNAMSNLVARVGLFTEAGRGTFEGIRRGVMADAGFDQEMRVLHEAAHCSDCPPLSGYWAEVGSLPELGSTACLVNCNCTWAFRRTVDGIESE